jgi:hypothetical protein
MKKSIYECVGSGVSWLLMILCVMALSVFTCNSARAQSSAQEEMSAGPTGADHAAVANAKVVYRHARPANTPAGRMLTKKEIAAAAATAAAAEVEGGSADADDQLRFEGDLSYLGGAVVQVAASHAIYLLPNGHCTVISTCWGNPEGFLRDLEVSEFIHLADQYTGTGANNRYSVGKHAMISYKPGSAPLTDADVQAFVHKVASTMAVGYGNIYHVFLPPGQDECFTATGGTCYSPDVPSTFFFCGYHSSVDFKDIGHVLYTVEPFQNVDGCSVRPGTSNGQLIDSTDNTLSHEMFETITDPDGNAWFNLKALALQGEEIADECSFVKINFTTGAAFFDPSVFIIGVHRYGVQPEYTNAEHACASNP